MGTLNHSKTDVNGDVWEGEQVFWGPLHESVFAQITAAEHQIKIVEMAVNGVRTMIFTAMPTITLAIGGRKISYADCEIKVDLGREEFEFHEIVGGVVCMIVNKFMEAANG